jgi:hypothetical protein
MKNRNVPQCNIVFKHSWQNKNPVILIIGQVANDFSIIETPSDEISTISIYKQIIINLLKNTNANLIFKAHPWERRRAPLFSPLTKVKIDEFTQSLPEIDRIRITVIENEPIQNIFQICDGVVGITSQGLLEACYYGFKPALMGDTFFSKKGFTQDSSENRNFLKNTFDKASWKLSLNEYEQFQNFIGGMFIEALIPNSKIASVLISEKLINPHAKLSTKHALTVINIPRIDWINLLKDIFGRPYVWVRLSRIWIKSQFKAQS